MTPRLENVAAPEPGRLPSPSVTGLDHGRHHARRKHRRKRRRDRLRNVLVVIIGIALLGGVAYAGYLMYGDFEEDEEQERQEIRAQFEPGSGDDLRDGIDELETRPQFNGPGVPALGVGNEP